MTLITTNMYMEMSVCLLIRVMFLFNSTYIYIQLISDFSLFAIIVPIVLYKNTDE